jgi:membrane protein DedA with SNARE-associated domain
MQQLIDSLVHTMEALGYPGIAILMFLEVIFPPIPSEVIMPFGGSVAAKGQMNLFGVVLAGSIGSMAGALVFYYLGKILGTERLVAFANKYGRWLTVSGKDIRRADAWFDKYGYFVVFFCRFIPGIRSLVSLPAGVAEMKVVPFLILTLIGNIIWNFVLTYAGFLLGDNYEQVDRYIGGWGKYILLALAVLLAILYVFRLVKQMREKPEEETPPQQGSGLPPAFATDSIQHQQPAYPQHYQPPVNQNQTVIGNHQSSYGPIPQQPAHRSLSEFGWSRQSPQTPAQPTQSRSSSSDETILYDQKHMPPWLRQPQPGTRDRRPPEE